MYYIFFILANLYYFFLQIPRIFFLHPTLYALHFISYFLDDAIHDGEDFGKDGFATLGRGWGFGGSSHVVLDVLCVARFELNAHLLHHYPSREPQGILCAKR